MLSVKASRRFAKGATSVGRGRVDDRRDQLEGRRGQALGSFLFGGDTPLKAFHVLG